MPIVREGTKRKVALAKILSESVGDLCRLGSPNILLQLRTCASPEHVGQYFLTAPLHRIWFELDLVRDHLVRVGFGPRSARFTLLLKL